MNINRGSFVVLADGTFFPGISVGSKGFINGEIVFNTSHTGYQEIITDPSYTGQIVSFTCPHIGNVGINPEDNESAAFCIKGAIFRAFSPKYSNWRATDSLGNFLLKNNIVAISEVDTRALTHHIRDYGSQNGCVVADNALSYEEALQIAISTKSIANQDLTNNVSTNATYEYRMNKDQNTHNIVVFDFGVKDGILRSLAKRNANLTIVPSNTSASDILKLNPEGILLSNGPGDPAACTEIIKNIQNLLTKNIPIFGICLGHQLLALASGALTKKMAFGHHGANHPILDITRNIVYISSQNHGFVVDEDSLPDFLEITHRSLFDGTIAGIRHKAKPVFSFQGHPEASPGPVELEILFDDFITEVANAKKKRY